MRSVPPPVGVIAWTAFVSRLRQHLLELACVADDGRQIRPRARSRTRTPTLRRDRDMPQAQRALDDAVQVERLALRLAAPREGEEVLHHLARAHRLGCG